MPTYTKVVLSGSTNGKGIKVAATGTAGTLIHAAGAGTSNHDELWIFAVNSTTAAKKLTIEWGEHTAPDGNIELTIQPESGLVLVIPGLILNNAMEVNAFCETADVVIIHGYVNRITA
jgi:hypothetical protein